MQNQYASLTDQRKSYLLITLMFTIVVDVMGFTLVFPLFPSLFLPGHAALLSTQTSFAVRYICYSVALALWPLAGFFGTPYLGQLSDKFGRKKILVICILITSMSYGLYAVSIYVRSIYLLFATRIIAGFFGANYNIAQAATADISSPELKMRNMGWITVAAAIGMVVGPMIASLTTNTNIVSWFSVATPFWVASIMTFCNAILIILLFKETYVVKGKAELFLSKIFSAFLFIFTDKRVIIMGLSFFFLNLGWLFYLTSMPLILAQIFHLNIQLMGLFFCVLGLGSVSAILFVQPKLPKKFSLKTIYISTILCMSVLLIISDIIPSLKELWAIVFVFSILQVLCYSSLFAMCSNAVSTHEQGKVMGGLGSVTSISSFLACILIGWLTHFSVLLPLLVGACVLLISGFLITVVNSWVKNKQIK